MRYLASITCALFLAISSPCLVVGLALVPNMTGEQDVSLINFAPLHGKMDEKLIQWLSFIPGQTQEEFYQQMKGKVMEMRNGSDFVGTLNETNFRKIFALNPGRRQHAFGVMRDWDWTLKDANATAAVPFTDVASFGLEPANLVPSRYHVHRSWTDTTDSNNLSTGGTYDGQTSSAGIEISANDSERLKTSEIAKEATRLQKLLLRIAEVENRSQATVVGISDGSNRTESLNTSEFAQHESFPAANTSKSTMNVPQSEDEWRHAFADAQASRINGKMGAFIRMVIKRHGGHWESQSNLAGIAPYYSGRAANKTYTELLEELRQASWVKNASWL